MLVSRSVPQSGDLIANRYRVDEALGQGGMGAAFAATNLITGKRVALKWILRDASATRLRRVIREARAAGMVKHANIVDVYDVGEHEGSLFLVMELLGGESLKALIDREGPLPLARLLSLLLPAFRGVRAAHRQGVIHRDLKPSNVFVCFDDSGEPATAKVLDFGVSKITKDGIADDPTLTDSGAPIGTPGYMAPEQLEDASHVDVRADVYACGVLLYRALSGRQPFEAESHAALAVKVLTAEPTPLLRLRPDLPSGVCEVVHTAMKRCPEQRFAQMSDLIAALELFSENEPTSGVRHVAFVRPRRTSPLRVAVVLGLSIAAGLAFGWRLSADRAAPPRVSVASTLAIGAEVRIPEPRRLPVEDSAALHTASVSTSFSKSSASETQPTPASVSEAQRAPERRARKARRVPIAQAPSVVAPAQPARESKADVVELEAGEF